MYKVVGKDSIHVHAFYCFYTRGSIPSSPLACVSHAVLLLRFWPEHPRSTHISFYNAEEWMGRFSMVSGLSLTSRGSCLYTGGKPFSAEYHVRFCNVHFVMMDICSDVYPTWKCNYIGDTPYFWEHRIHNISLLRRTWFLRFY